jgi:hypothetical protein
MDLSIVFSRAMSGLDAPLVRVEAHLSNGLPAFHIVGMPETAVRESKDRVRSAILNSHFKFPDRRITISLAPADLPKEGGRFDLPSPHSTGDPHRLRPGTGTDPGKSRIPGGTGTGWQSAAGARHAHRGPGHRQNPAQPGGTRRKRTLSRPG